MKSNERPATARGSTPTSAIRIAVMLRLNLSGTFEQYFTFYLAKVQCGESCILPVSVLARVNRDASKKKFVHAR
jgi:hypothetical protein